MDEDLIETVAYATDSFIGDIIELMPNPMVATTIILSRLVLVNDEVGTGTEFRSLLKEVAEKHRAIKPEIH